jgi:hypothetical protein
MENTRSDEPRGASEPEERLPEASATPEVEPGAARPEPMAQGAQRQEGQERPRTRGEVFQERLRRFAHQILSKSERKR